MSWWAPPNILDWRRRCCYLILSCRVSGKRALPVKDSNLYSDAKPYARWWWFSGEILEDDIRCQLDWVRQSGFGGVEIAWLYSLPGSRPGPNWLSPELARVVSFAKQYAGGLGLGCDFTFGTLWPFGGSFVDERDASMTYKGPSDQRLQKSWESPYSPPGRILNHLDRNALEHYSQKMLAFLKSSLPGRPSALFCDSWEVDTRGLWTSGFGGAFFKRYGYSVEEFMPELDSHPDVRYDYRKLLSEYVLNEFYVPFGEICRGAGAFSRVQCHGAPTDLLAAYAAADVPESEAILFDPHFSRFAASAAALSGKSVVSAESFTCLYGWVPWPGPPPFVKQEQAADLKLLADALFANGVNLIVWHGMPYNPPGGRNQFYATVHIGPDSAFADELPAFNAYMEKVCSFMRKGRAYSDVAVYLPLEDNWMKGTLPQELRRPSALHYWELQYQRMPAELQGCHPLWVSLPFLLDARIEDGHLECGHARFSSLYVDAEWLDSQALRRILELARAGLHVCLKREPSQPGRAKDADYEKNLSELLSLDNVSEDFGRVAVNLPLVEGKEIPEFFCRCDGDDVFVFFAHPLSKGVQYPMRYGQSFIDRQLEVPVTLNANGRSVDVTLTFEPYQSLLLRLGPDLTPTFEDIHFQPQTPRTA
jgi:hypothetical protein